MVAHRCSILALLALPLALVAACDKVPLLAPTGSVITLFPVTTTVSLNSEVTIIATVIENGSAPAGTGPGTGPPTTTTNTGAGTPVQNGTLITFTTTIGRIEPAEARTHNGQVSVRLITAGTSGSATITAYSGGASAQITNLKIGTAAAKTVLVTTTPQALGASGGTVQVTAGVTDDGGNPLSGIPVIFSTDKGAISPSTAPTDGSGNATATLTTTATAKITATAGGTATAGTATVTVNARSLTLFSSDALGTTQVGTLVTFTVTPAIGANITNVHVEFGDGASTDLGPIGAQTTTRHAYQSAGIFTATASARDASGDVQQLTTTVSVGSLQLTLSASPSPADRGAPVVIEVKNLAAQVREFQWFWDDGTPSYSTTAPQTTKVFSSAGSKTIRVDVIGLSGGRIGTAQITMTIR